MASESHPNSFPLEAPCEFEVEFTVADYYCVLLRHMLLRRRWMLPLTIVVAVIFVTAEALPIADGGDVIAHIVLAVAALIFFGCIFGCPYLSARRILKDYSSRIFKYSFSELGIQAEGANSSARIGWLDVKAAQETPRYIVLTLRGAGLLGLPKRFIKADKLYPLRRTIQDAIGSRAKFK